MGAARVLFVGIPGVLLYVGGAGVPGQDLPPGHSGVADVEEAAGLWVQPR